MKKIRVLFLTVMFGLFLVSGAFAATIDLFEWAFNVDGNVSNPPSAAGLNTVGMNPGTGLGSMTFTQTGAGAHSVLSFFDHEIDQGINTFFNEYGSVSGSPAAGQSWEIDEPGYSTGAYVGDIYSNFTAGSLDNMIFNNNYPNNGPDDVSMALGWNYNLAANEKATITFTVSERTPSGFYLRQTDPDSQASIYFYSSLRVDPTGVPEPVTITLLGLGLFGLASLKRKFNV